MKLPLAAVFAAWCAGAAATQDDATFFEARVRPVLIARCYECHAGEKAKGGLSLDTRAGWERGGDSGPALVPGNSEESLLVKAIGYSDDSVAMPPSGKLPDEEIAALTEWVRRGAPDPRVAPAKIGGMTVAEAQGWWAFRPITTPPLPAARAFNAVRNPIDRFIQSSLEAEGLSPSFEADRRTLIRRATYDLTGLPPTPEEVERFFSDESPDAYERLLDRLLASPHYGEHWGRHWLDVVRYADTAGENTDRPLPHMWRYRNWVFDAFGRDLPFDEFVRLQIAGDVLRSGEVGSAYAEGIIATGYLALARRFGHDSDKDMHLTHEDVIDNLGKTFLGLTVACARCHDHKYDPVTQKDYYALYGIFAGTRFSFSGCEAKGRPRDLVPTMSAAEVEALKRPWLERKSQTDAVLKEIAARTGEVGDRLKSQFDTATETLVSSNVSEGGSVNFGPFRVASREGEVLLLAVSPNGSHGADSTLIEWEITEIGGSARRWSVTDLVPDLVAGNPHPGRPGDPTAWYFLDLKDGLALLDERNDVVQDRGELKAWRSGETPSVFVNTSDQPVTVWTDLPPQSFFVHPGPEGPVAVAWTSPIDRVLEIRGRIADAHPGGGDGISFRLDRVATPEAATSLDALADLAREKADVLRRFAAAGPEPAVPVAFAVAEDQPRSVRLHQRGDPEMPGDEVPRRWLTIFGADSVPPGDGSGRRELAEWVVRNPLTTRVIVNRVWQGHFGKGLVRTPNDFGSRGERPTHPELLEWLGAWFELGGGSIKSLHRLIMTSAAYRRSSAADEVLISHDPENRQLARFDRRRLSAEEIRDSLLVSGGNLDSAPGTTHPFPAVETWSYTQHNPFVAVYENEKRTAYQMVQRQRRHPFLALFDGADPNASTAARQTTTAPTQALYFLNDPFFHAQSTRLAASLSTSPNEADRINRLFRRVLQRTPTEAERIWAADFLAPYPGGPSEKWAALARVLLAGNEFLHVD